MQRTVVATLQAAFARSMSMTRQFIQVCPGVIWEKKFGGWPVWQQVYHSIAVLDLFILDKDQAPTTEPLVSRDEYLLNVCAETPVSRERMLEFADVMEAACTRFIDALDDSMLGNEQCGLSAKLGASFNMAMALSMMNSHTMYHLGSCDAALREQGLKGVF